MRSAKAPIFAHLFILLMSCAGCRPDPELYALRLDVKDLKRSVQRLENDNYVMLRDIWGRTGAEAYIVIDTAGNRLYLREKDAVLLDAVASTGSGKKLEEKGGRKWLFQTPKGVFTILDKETNPVWYKPDWAFVEDNLPIPPPDSPQRIVKGVLGKYAFGLGGGFKIHGTPYKKLLGQAVSHGCIRLTDADIEKLYENIEVGTKVYIY